jgi:hypothetical protein
MDTGVAILLSCISLIPPFIIIKRAGEIKNIRNYKGMAIICVCTSLTIATISTVSLIYNILGTHFTYSRSPIGKKCFECSKPAIGYQVMSGRGRSVSVPLCAEHIDIVTSVILEGKRGTGKEYSNSELFGNIAVSLLIFYVPAFIFNVLIIYSLYKYKDIK